MWMFHRVAEQSTPQRRIGMGRYRLACLVHCTADGTVCAVVPFGIRTLGGCHLPGFHHTDVFVIGRTSYCCPQRVIRRLASPRLSACDNSCVMLPILPPCRTAVQANTPACMQCSRWASWEIPLWLDQGRCVMPLPFVYSVRRRGPMFWRLRVFHSIQ